MDFLNMQNGILGSTSDTLRTQSGDINSRTAISRMFIAAVCSPREAELLNTDITTLKMQQAG